MKNELKLFVSHIELIIKGLNKKTSIDELETIKLPQLLEREKNSIEDAFQYFLVNEKQQDYLVRLTGKYYDILVALSNKAYRAIPDLLEQGTSHQITPIKAIYLNVVMVIEELLQSVVVNSRNLIADELIASNYYTDLHSRNLQTRFLDLENSFLDHNLSPDLLKLLHNYFFSFLSSKKHKYAYSELDYAENFLFRLERITAEQTHKDWGERIWELIVKVNFNKLAVMEYIKECIQQKTAKSVSPLEAYKSLILKLKIIKQTATDPNWNYQPKMMSLKLYIENTVIEELHWLEKNNPKMLNEVIENYRNSIMIDTTLEEMNLWAVLNIGLNTITDAQPGDVFHKMQQFLVTLYPNAETDYHYKSDLNEFDPKAVLRYYKYLNKQSAILLSHFPELKKD